MIVVRFKGGVGNQLFQYAAGRALATRHKVPLYFDTGWYRQTAHQVAVRRSFDLGHFAVQGRMVEPADLRFFFFNQSWRMPVRMIGHLIRPFCGRQITTSRNVGYDPGFESLGSRVLLDGYFQDLRYFESVRVQVREEFTPRIPLPAQISDYAAKIAGEPTICIQVRRTDFVQNVRTMALHGTCSLDYYKRAWADLCYRIPAARGLVFTDDFGWANEAFRGWEGVSIVGSEWDGPDYMYKFFLMQSCRHFIIANSTWGWWAAWLGSFPGKTVIMPEHWFADPTLNAAAAGLRLPGWFQC